MHYRYSPVTNKDAITSGKYYDPNKTLKRVLLVLFVLFVVTTIASSVTFFYHASSSVINISKDDSLIRYRFCPACFGSSKCSNFLAGNVNTRNSEQEIMDNFVSEIEVGQGTFKEQYYLVNYNYKNMSAVAETVCKRQIDYLSIDSGEKRKKFMCESPRLGIWSWLPKFEKDKELDRSFFSLEFQNNQQNQEFIHAPFAPLVRCPSERLFNRLKKSFLERTTYGAKTRMLRFDELMFTYTLAMNPTNFLIYFFSDKERLKKSFPEYHGACGQFFLYKNIGKPLVHYLGSSYDSRRTIVRKLLELPSKLENIHAENEDSSDGFTLYLGDSDFEKIFFSEEDNSIKLVDLKYSMLVDSLHLQKYSSKEFYSFGKNATEYAKNQSDVNNGISYQMSRPPSISEEHAEVLCETKKTDHNEWFVCNMILKNQDIIRDFPSNVRDKIQLCRDGSFKRQTIKGIVGILNM